MLKERDYIFNRLNIATDFCCLAFIVYLSHITRNHILPTIAPSIFSYQSDIRSYWWLMIFLPMISVLILSSKSYYYNLRTQEFWRLVSTPAIAVLGASLSTMIIAFVFWQRNAGTESKLLSILNGEYVSRAILLIYPVAGFLYLIAKSIIIRRAQSSLKYNEEYTRSVLLIGGNETSITQMIDAIKTHPFWGFSIIGFLADANDLPKSIKGVTNLGDTDLFFQTLEKNPTDEVVILPENQSWESLQSFMHGCEEMGIRSHLPLKNMVSTIAKPTLEHFGEIPLISLNPVQEMGTALLFKYLIDRILAIILLIVLFPLFVMLFVSIKFKSKNISDPAFYGQTRCGLHGKPFTLWKFRSMELNADDRLFDLKDKNEMSGPVFKMKNDPRVTSIGRWLRKTSLDELPQLWNVAIGQMSLVGPRPPLPSEVVDYDRWQRRRLSMKPGITCIWQVSGRNNVAFETWMKQDLEYIDNWSLTLDFKILLRTVYVVITGHGAM